MFTGGAARGVAGGVASGVAIGRLVVPTFSWSSARTRFGWLAVPAVIAGVSRIFSIVLLAIAAQVRGLPLVGDIEPAARAAYAGITSSWDARWYLNIAANGYHAEALQGSALGGHHDYAFFPLWPISIDLASLGILPPQDVAVVLAPVLFVLAAIVLAAVLARPFGRPVATGAVGLLAFSPAAYVLSTAYSEPLFLLLAALAFLSTDPAKPARRGLLAGLAMLTRIAGAAIVAAEGVRFLLSRGRDVGALAAAVGGMIGFAAWWLTVAAISGSPTGFLEGSPDWSPSTGIANVVDVIRTADVWQLGQLAFAGIVLVGGLLAMRRDRILGLYAICPLQPVVPRRPWRE